MTHDQKSKSRVAALSVISNSLLVVFKIVTGLVIGSVSVISEAIHSGVDLLAALIAFFAVRSSGKPADKNHPFGHGKIENISGTVEALLIFAAAVWIIYEAVQKWLHPRPMDEAGWGVAVMMFSAGMNWWVSGRLFAVGKQTDSHALQADAWHLRTDVWTSLGVMIGLGTIWLGRLLFPGVNLDWVDPTAAFGVALLILRAAYELTIQAGKDLLDESLAPAEEAAIREILLAHCPPVCGFHRLRTRKAGHLRFVEVHLQVDPKMTVETSHHLTRMIIKDIERRLENATVIIHIEPCNGFCSPVCLEGCRLSPEKRERIRRKHKPKAY